MGYEIKEHKEKSIEGAVFLDKEALYDTAIPLRLNIGNLLDEALDEKYRNKNTTILQKLPEEQMAALLPKVRTIELKAGIVILKDEAGNELKPTFDIREGLAEARKEIYEHDCELCRRRSKRLRIYEFRHTSYSDMLLRMMAARSLPEGKKKEAIEAAVPVIDQREEESNERVRASLDDDRASREDQLLLVMAEKEKEFDFSAEIDRETFIYQEGRFVDTRENHFRYKYQTVDLKVDKTEEDFERRWLDFDGAQDIHELCTKGPDPRAGYVINPLKKHWGDGYRKQIFKLIENSANGRVYFQDVENMLYEDRFDNFVEELHKDFGISEEALELLQDSEDENGDEYLDEDSLTNSYARLNRLLGQLDRFSDPAKVPEEYKELFQIREQIRSLVQILGDYTVYIAKLTRLIGKLRYNAAKIATERDRLMKEFDVDGYGNRRNTPRTKVVESLRTAFIEGVESAREYSSELAQIYSDVFDEDHNRAIEFQDLNGETLTLESNWFLEQQSPDDAYRLAYEAVEEQKQNADGTWSPEFKEEAGKNHLNTLLELGVYAYLAMPGSRSMKEIIDGLSDEGAEVGPGFPLRYGEGGLRANARNLFETLELKNLADLGDMSTLLAERKKQERLMFIRMGSVIWKNNRISEQEQNYEKQKQKRLAVVKLSDKQAEELLADLESRGFPRERHQEIKKKLVGGIGVLLGDTPAAAAFLHFQLGDGWSFDFSGGDISGEGAMGGVGVSKKFHVTKTIDIAVNAGVGATNRGGVAIAPGASTSFTKKFDSVDITLQAGAGVSFGAVPVAGLSLGAGFDWGKEQEKLEKHTTAKEAGYHLDQLDLAKDKYAEVKTHPNQYPELYEGLIHIESIKSINDDAKRVMFENWLQMFRTEIRSLSVDETTKTPLERFIPTGAGAGIAMVGDMPVPYAYLEFSAWSRKLVYRVATDAQHASRIAESAAIDVALQRQLGVKTIETKTLSTTEGVIFDDAAGRFVLPKTGGAKIVWSQFNQQFTDFRDDLSKNAKIFVGTTNTAGLLILKPQEAHGITQLYIDPELKDDVVVVTDQNRLFISVKKNTEMYIRREDVGYPFEDRTVSETSTIVITNNPHVPTDVIKKDSPGFMEQRPGKNWIYRQRDLGETSEKRKKKLDAKAQNFKTWAEYKSWWGTEGREDRMKFEGTLERETSYNGLVGVISDKREAKDMVIRNEVKKKIEELIGKKTTDDDIKKKEELIRKFRKISTEQFDKDKREEKSITFDWERDYPKISAFLKAEVGNDLNSNELQFVHQAFLIESFLDLQSRDAKAAHDEYCRALEKFHLPLAKAVFADYLKHDGASELATGENPEAKADEMAIWLIDRFRNIDITAAGAAVKDGTIFATFVGMPGPEKDKKGNAISITGLRAFYNMLDVGEEYGVLGKDVLDVKNKGMEGKIARFWLRELSPYRTGQNLDTIPEPSSGADYREFHDAIYENLRSPFVLKLIPHIAIMFTEEEMKQLKAIYESDKGVTPPPSQLLITSENIGVIKKLFEKCDEVRNAQLAGEPQKIDLANGFRLVIHTEIYEGIYKRCGNPSGLLFEKFALENTITKQYFVVAGYGESDIGVTPGFTRADFKVALGAALPIPAKEVVRAGPSPQVPSKPAPPKVTGVSPADETPTGETPPTATVDQPEAASVPGNAEEGGTNTGGSTGTEQEGGAEA